MELKELILSTLEELDERIAEDSAKAELQEQEDKVETEIFQEERESALLDEVPKEQETPEVLHDSDELAYLEHTKERLLVLFEGLQAQETKNLEAKLDITLNFLEFQLATIEDRLEAIK